MKTLLRLPLRALVCALLLATAATVSAQFSPSSLTSTPGTSPSQPLSLVAGTTYTNALTFTITFGQLGVTISSIEVRGTPPGLTVDGSTTVGSAFVVSNRPTATFSGTPTTTGAFTVQVNAITSTGLNSISQVSPWEIYFNVTGTSTGGGGTTPPPVTPPPVTPPPTTTPVFDTNSPGAQLARSTVMSEHGFNTAGARQQALENRLNNLARLSGPPRLASRQASAETFCADDVAPARSGGTQPNVSNGLYAEVNYRRMEYDSVNGLPSAESTTSGAIVGGDWNIGDSLLVGGFIAMDTTEVDLDVTGSGTDQESVTPGLYARYAFDDWSVIASAAFSNDDYDLFRRTISAGVARTAAASSSGSQRDFSVTVSRAFTDGNWIIAPRLGFSSSRWEMDRYTETGTITTLLTVSDRSVSSFRGKAGADVYHTGERFNQRIGVTWIEEFKSDRTATAALVGSTTGFSVAGRPPPKYFVLFSYGLDARLAENITAYASLSGGWSDTDNMTGDFAAGVKWSF
jgi:uncharacterized protein YhjY with autotransporter beta-barrel domain